MTTPSLTYFSYNLRMPPKELTPLRELPSHLLSPEAIPNLSCTANSYLTINAIPFLEFAKVCHQASEVRVHAAAAPRLVLSGISYHRLVLTPGYTTWVLPGKRRHISMNTPTRLPPPPPSSTSRSTSSLYFMSTSSPFPP